MERYADDGARRNDSFIIIIIPVPDTTALRAQYMNHTSCACAAIGTTGPPFLRRRHCQSPPPPPQPPSPPLPHSSRSRWFFPRTTCQSLHTRVRAQTFYFILPRVTHDLLYNLIKYMIFSILYKLCIFNINIYAKCVYTYNIWRLIHSLYTNHPSKTRSRHRHFTQRLNVYYIYTFYFIYFRRKNLKVI